MHECTSHDRQMNRMIARVGKRVNQDVTGNERSVHWDEDTNANNARRSKLISQDHRRCRVIQEKRVPLQQSCQRHSSLQTFPENSLRGEEGKIEPPP